MHMGKHFGTPAAADLQITVDVESTRTVLHLAGEIDAASSARLRALLGEQVDERLDVVIDLSRVTFIDSSGLGVLVGALRRVQEHGHRLVLRAPTASLQRVLEVTGLASAFPVEH
jgi:anti-sigma B factor antagonist